MNIIGKVVPNKRNGTKFGYPTANMAFEDKAVEGLFVGYTKLNKTKDKVVEKAFGDKSLPSIIFIGTAETVNENEHRLESHILDFPLIDLYGSELEVIILHKLRDNHKFENVEKLIEQMKKDEQDAREWFAEK